MQDSMITKMLNLKGAGNFKIQDIARAATVTRWHSVNCLRYPSIAEHSWLVAMYARDILNRINPNATDTEKLILMEYCLFHDLPEVLTGDMATPVKRLLESLFPDGESPLDLIEEALCPEYKVLKDRISGTYLAVIAKLADVLEAVKFIYVEGKSYIQRQDQNRKVIEALSSLTDLVEANIKGLAGCSESIEQVKGFLHEISDNENNDAIYGILIERQTNYLQRAEDAKALYPEFNWDIAKDVHKELLYDKTSQIDFIDR